MPAVAFLCPDGVETLFTECFERCRLYDELPAHRCLSVRTLRAVAEQRAWTGKPSTTQLIKGTREAALEIMFPYAVDPQESLYRVHGSKGHDYLASFVGENELGEIRLYGSHSSGQFDFYDPELKSLYDSKFWGSYKVNMALGRHQVEVTEVDEEGSPVLFKTGARKGQPKTKKEWADGGYRDILDTAIQLNDYRYKLMDALGIEFPIEQLYVEAIVRDGGAYISHRRDLRLKGLLIPVGKISRHWIDAYLQVKSMRLVKAVEREIIPPKCNHRETWGGRKCQDYCNVRKYCQERRSEDAYYLLR